MELQSGKVDDESSKLKRIDFYHFFSFVPRFNTFFICNDGRTVLVVSRSAVGSTAQKAGRDNEEMQFY